jgi:hypothetical protein
MQTPEITEIDDDNDDDDDDDYDPTVYFVKERRGRVYIEECSVPEFIAIQDRTADSLVKVVVTCVDEGMEANGKLLFCLGLPTYEMLEGVAKHMWHDIKCLELTAVVRGDEIYDTMILDRDNTEDYFLQWTNCGFNVLVRRFKRQLAEISYADAFEYANVANATFIDDESAVFQLLNPEALIAQNKELYAGCEELLDFTVLLELLKWQHDESDPVGIIRAIAQSAAEVVNCIYCIRDCKSGVSVRTDVPIIGDRAEGRVDVLVESER